MASIPKILVVQFRRAGSVRLFEQRLYLNAGDGLAQLSFHDAFDDSVLWNDPAQVVAGYDAVIFGGSGDLFFDGGRPSGDELRRSTAEVAARFEPIVRHIRDVNMPFLGICFGHQLIGHVLGAEVAHDAEQSKTGSFEVCFSDDSSDLSITDGIPKCFVAQYWHADSVTKFPHGVSVLAAGKNCTSSMLQYGPMQYTMQFHPELTIDDLHARLRAEGADPTSELKPSPEAIQILRNFFRMVGNT